MQWVDEVREKAPGLRVALYHGPNRARDYPPVLLACYDIVISTYNVMYGEFKAAPMGGLFRVRWHRCGPLIVDFSTCRVSCGVVICVHTACK